MQAETNKRIFFTALFLALFFSLVVSITAVVLRPIQQKNEELERNKNILIAMGKPVSDIENVFENIKIYIYDLEKNSIEETENVREYFRNFKKLSENKDTSISTEGKLEGIKRIPKKIPFYVLYNNSKIECIVLPIYGNGLWSTMYGFIAIESDGNTIRGLTFYDQKETPGLGGEVDNPNWKAQWVGKKIYDEDGNLRITVLKGSVDKTDENAKYQIDGISGATMTTNGVNQLIRFWLSDKGFGKLLKNLNSYEILPGDRS
jgi:Na+-transporting NADH:ubiquinone oxidoreductase subunit C